jgi:hypothetical protein
MQYLWPALVILASAFPGVAAWSEPIAAEAPVRVGTKVRLVAPEVVGQRIQGTVVETNLESLVVGTEGQRHLTVPWRAITRLEVSTRRHSHTRKGLVIGAGAGVALSVVLPKCVNEGCTSDVSFDPTFALLYGLGGSMWGALIGAMVKTDEWSSVPLGVAVTPTPGRGVRVLISISVR